jgi:DNA-binding NtrC family response regulator
MLPPLRERMGDIPLLVTHFIKHLNAMQQKNIAGVTDEALGCLMSHGYPGNIRELENILERAFILCKGGMIEPRHLPEPLYVQDLVDDSRQPLEALSMRDVEAVFLTSALRRNGWNRLKTARQLGMHKSTLFRKIKALHIQIPATGNSL